jgi:hypothetical protein
MTGGCAETRGWENPHVPQEQWSVDRSQCRTWAEQQADRDYALSQQADRGLNDDRGGQWASQMNLYSARQRQQELFESCMKQRGYRLVELSGAAES